MNANSRLRGAAHTGAVSDAAKGSRVITSCPVVKARDSSVANIPYPKILQKVNERTSSTLLQRERAYSIPIE